MDRVQHIDFGDPAVPILFNLPPVVQYAGRFRPGQEEDASVAVQIHRASGWLDTRHHRLQPRHHVAVDECGTIDGSRRRRRPAAATPASAGPATPAPSQAFKGVNVNLLTFNGPQVAEPLQRRAPDFEALTGAHVNVVATGFQTIYDKALLDASTGTNSFDAYVFDPQWMGDFVGPGYLPT